MIIFNDQYLYRSTHNQPIFRITVESSSYRWFLTPRWSTPGPLPRWPRSPRHCEEAEAATRRFHRGGSRCTTWPPLVLLKVCVCVFGPTTGFTCVQYEWYIYIHIHIRVLHVHKSLCMYVYIYIYICTRRRKHSYCVYIHRLSYKLLNSTYRCVICTYWLIGSPGITGVRPLKTKDHISADPYHHPQVFRCSSAGRTTWLQGI